MQDPDKEIRPLVTCLKTGHASLNVSQGSHRFSEFLDLKKLIESIARLRHVTQSCNGQELCKGRNSCKLTKSFSSYQKAKQTGIKVVQKEFYQEDIKIYKRETPFP